MAEMIELARSSVQTWESDNMGHLNVQFYAEKAEHALAALGVHLGLGPRFIRGEGARLITRDHHIRFLHEQRPGSPFFLRGGVVAMHDFGLRIYTEMVSTANGDVGATFTFDVELADQDTRELYPLPEKAKAAAKRLMIALPQHGSPRGLSLYPPRNAPTLAKADAMGMVHTYLGEVGPAVCDPQGFLLTRRFIGIVSDSIPNLLVQKGAGTEHANDYNKTGGAALEYRLIYRKYPRMGDVVMLLSGLKEVNQKTYIWCHWMFDLETGEAMLTSESVAVVFDLQARKTMPIPDEMRAYLHSLVIENLGV